MSAKELHDRWKRPRVERPAGRMEGAARGLRRGPRRHAATLFNAQQALLTEGQARAAAEKRPRSGGAVGTRRRSHEESI
jgi:hypothetical protein